MRTAFHTSKYEFCKELYLSGQSLVSLCKEFQMGNTRFKDYLLSQGVVITQQPRKALVNKSIFDQIDTEEKAYWLGFIYADGYIADKCNTFEVGLQLGDLVHLQKLKVFLGIGNDITFYRNACRLYVSDPYFKQSLITKGVTPRKSLTLTFPSFLPDDLTSHFVRGYMDGDGSIYIRNRWNGFLVTQCVGTQSILEGIMNAYGVKQNLHREKKWKSQNTYYFMYSNRKALAFCEYLYKNSTVYLERKYDKYIAILKLGKNGEP